MYDEQKTLADKVDRAMLDLNECVIDILYGSDGAGDTVLDNFNSDIIGFHGFINYESYINRETNKFTDSVYNVLKTNSTNRGGLTSYGLRINGVNPLFGVPHDYSTVSTASKLVGLMNTFQHNKSNLLVELMNDVYNYNVEILKNLITVVLNREVLGQKLGVYADVKKIVEKASGSVNPQDVVAASAALGGFRTYEVIGSSGNVLATFGGGAGTAGTELAVVGGSGTELALAGGTELATVGSTELAATSTAASSAASGSLFASVASIAIPAIIGTAVITGGLTVAVIIETRKRIKKFATLVDNFDNLMKEYVNSFYCNAISYPGLVYDDSNPEGPIVFRSDAVTSTSSQLALSLIDVKVERGVELLSGYLYDCGVKMRDKLNNFLVSNNGYVGFQDVVRCINNILANIKVVVKQFNIVENDIDSDIDSIALQVIRGNWGNGQARRVALEKAGYNYDDIQSRVNELLSSKVYSNIGTAVVTTGLLTSKVIDNNIEEDTNGVISSFSSNTVIDSSSDNENKTPVSQSNNTNQIPTSDSSDNTNKKPIDQSNNNTNKQPIDSDRDDGSNNISNDQDVDKNNNQNNNESNNEDNTSKSDVILDSGSSSDNSSSRVTPLVNNNGGNNYSNVANEETITDSSVSADQLEVTQDSITDFKEPNDEFITTTTINKVKQTDSKSAGNVVPVILGVGAAGALAAAGTRYIKNKKDDQYYSDDENYFSDEEEISETSEDDQNRKVPKYKSGAVNELILDDIDNVEISNDSISNDTDTLDFE